MKNVKIYVVAGLIVVGLFFGVVNPESFESLVNLVMGSTETVTE